MGDPTRSGMSISVCQGMTYGLYATCTGGLYLTGLVTLLGGGMFEYSLLSAIPLFAGAIQIASAHVGQDLASRRRSATIALALSLLFWIAAVAALMSVDGSSALVIFFVCYAANQCLTAIHVNLWTAWISDLVPPRIRGRYFGSRAMLCAIPALIIGVITGHFLDHLKERGEEMTGILVIVSAGILFGLISAAMLARQYEPPIRRRPAPIPFRESIRIPLRNANFRRFMLFVLFFNFFNGVASPVWFPFTLNVLRVPNGTLMEWATIAGIVGLLTFRVWGGFSDRFGNKPILIVTIMITSLHPLCYIVARPDFPYPVLVDYVSSAVMWGGYGIAIFNLLLLLSSSGEREMSVALWTILTGVSFGMGSLVCGVVMDHIPSVDLLGKVWTRYDIVFLTTSAARVISVFLLIPIVEDRAKPVGNMIAVAFAEWKEKISSIVLVVFRR